jgi:hypothetical protein
LYKPKIHKGHKNKLLLKAIGKFMKNIHQKGRVVT